MPVIVQIINSKLIVQKYRTLELLSQVSKIRLNIFMEKLKEKINLHLRED